MLKIETLAIGDEILTGKISDTNSTFVANTLFGEGFRLTATGVVLDDFQDIEAAILECSKKADVVAVFGGLGPTSDDKTAECVARMLDCSLAIHEESREKLVRFHEARNRPITSQSLKQVLYPQKAIPLLNLNGMAPGFHCTIGKATFFFHPGVPSEMKKMFTEYMLPYVRERAGQKGEIAAQTWRCLGIFESELQRVMDPIECKLPSYAWLGYRTKFPENHLTLYYRMAESTKKNEREEFAEEIGKILEPWSYSDENRDLEAIIARELGKRKWTIAFAESCTGGLTVQRLTRFEEASKYVWGGAVCYQVTSKKTLLNVDVGSEKESVSESCSSKLAESLLGISGCDVAAAITGWVGPNGGTEKDRPGTLYTCVVGKGEGFFKTESRMVQAVRTREENQWAASTYLLNEIRRAFLNLL